ncbi:MAG: cation:proton antiporter [Verrucomicrobiales bacterium]
MNFAHESDLRVFFIQLAIVVTAARCFGWIALRLGQPRVVGEILGGLALGPSLFGLLAPDAFSSLFGTTNAEPLTFVSQIGLVLFMFQTGMEFDFAHLKERSNRGAVLGVTVGSVLLPLLLGYGLAQLLYPVFCSDSGIERGHFCAFVAVALAITALPILGRIMASLEISRTRMGSVTISAAAFNDIIGWVLLAAISTAAAKQFSPEQLVLQVVSIAVFAVVMWTAVRPLVRRFAARVSHTDGLSLDYAAGAIVLVLLAGAITSSVGIFAAFGGFAVGVLLSDSAGFSKAWSARMEPFIAVFLLPVFFTCTGLRTDSGQLDSLEQWLWCGMVVVVATASKWFGAYWGAVAFGIPKSEALCIAVMMNTRALMELVVLNVGYELGVLPRPVFTILVIMAVVATLVTTPLLKRFLPHVQSGAP